MDTLLASQDVRADSKASSKKLVYSSDKSKAANILRKVGKISVNKLKTRHEEA